MSRKHSSMALRSSNRGLAQSKAHRTLLASGLSDKNRSDTHGHYTRTGHSPRQSPSSARVDRHQRKRRIHRTREAADNARLRAVVSKPTALFSKRSARIRNVNSSSISSALQHADQRRSRAVARNGDLHARTISWTAHRCENKVPKTPLPLLSLKRPNDSTSSQMEPHIHEKKKSDCLSCFTAATNRKFDAESPTRDPFAPRYQEQRYALNAPSNSNYFQRSCARTSDCG